MKHRMSKVLILLLTAQTMASMPLAAGGCFSENLELLIREKADQRLERRVLEREERQKKARVHLARSNQQAEATAANRRARIEWARKQVNDGTEGKRFKPSELKRLKQAVNDLESEGRQLEAKRVRKLYDKTEEAFQTKKSRWITLTPEEQKLIDDRIIVSKDAQAQLEKLPKNLQNFITTKQFLKIAKEPETAGRVLDSYLYGFRKFKFSYFDGSDYRIIYQLKGEKAEIFSLGNRKQVYGEAIDRLKSR